MNLHNGTLYLAILCCIWPLVFHFAIVAAPHVWGWITRHMPEKH